MTHAAASLPRLKQTSNHERRKEDLQIEQQIATCILECGRSVPALDP
jgi:hypothetical protein